MSKLTIQLLILGTIVTGWGIFMLSIHYKHKKRMKEIEEEWAERRRRWQLEEHDRWFRLESEVPTEWIRRSAMMPNEGYMPSAMFKTDKLSPPKKMGKHTMR